MMYDYISNWPLKCINVHWVCIYCKRNSGAKWGRKAKEKRKEGISKGEGKVSIGVNSFWRSIAIYLDFSLQYKTWKLKQYLIFFDATVLNPWAVLYLTICTFELCLKILEICNFLLNSLKLCTVEVCTFLRYEIFLGDMHI